VISVQILITDLRLHLHKLFMINSQCIKWLNKS